MVKLSKEVMLAFGLGAFFVLALILTLFAPVSALTNVTLPLGITIHHSTQNLLLDYDGCFFSTIQQYARISSSETQPPFYEIWTFQPTGLSATYVSNFTFATPYGYNLTLVGSDTYNTKYESGLVNATIQMHFANGTSATNVYSTMFLPFPDYGTLTFPITLQRGDSASIQVCKGAPSNLTRIQAVFDTADEAVQIPQYPDISAITSGMVTVVGLEVALIQDIWIFLGLALKILMLVAVPVFIVMFAFWALRQLRNGGIRAFNPEHRGK